MAWIFKIGISRNTKCDNLVGFLKSGHKWWFRDVPTVVSTDHHSDKIATTANSLTSTKISIWMKILKFQLPVALHNTYICMYVLCSVNKEFPRHYLTKNLKITSFGDFKSIYITTTLQNLGTSLVVFGKGWILLQREEECHLPATRWQSSMQLKVHYKTLITQYTYAFILHM